MPPKVTYNLVLVVCTDSVEITRGIQTIKTRNQRKVSNGKQSIQRYVSIASRARLSVIRYPGCIRYMSAPTPYTASPGLKQRYG